MFASSQVFNKDKKFAIQAFLADFLPCHSSDFTEVFKSFVFADTCMCIGRKSCLRTMKLLTMKSVISGRCLFLSMFVFVNFSF